MGVHLAGFVEEKEAGVRRHVRNVQHQDTWTLLRLMAPKIA
jgi:hypothetical protein